MKKIRFTVLLICFSISYTCSHAQNQTIGLFFNDSLSFNGYTLFSPVGKSTYLIDNCGELVHSWQSDYTPGLSVYLLENGNLLRTAKINNQFPAGGSGGRIEMRSWESTLLWAYHYASETFNQHHDICPLPNGNVLVLAWEKYSEDAAIAHGRNPNLVMEDGVWMETVVELQPDFQNNDATIVWKWNLWNHLIQEHDANMLNFGTVAEHPELIDFNFEASEHPDWIHANSLDYNPELDQIIINSRNLHEFWIIGHSTTTAEAASHSGGNSGKGGDILYRWGNPQAYQQGSAIDQRFFGQHHANWVKKGYPDEGKILVFNNGAGRPPLTIDDFSTIDMLAPPIDSNGNYIYEANSAFGPESLTWMYQDTPPQNFYSGRISGVHQLPNGNFLICEGQSGHFFEVNKTGQKLWSYVNPIFNNIVATQGHTAVHNSVFRINRYAPDYAAFEGRDLTPQGPIELEAIDTECTLFPHTVSTTLPLSPHKNLKILGNPFTNILSIQNPNTIPLKLTIYDLQGRKIWNSSADFQTEINIHTNDWAKGMYFLHSQIDSHFTIQKIIKI